MKKTLRIKYLFIFCLLFSKGYAKNEAGKVPENESSSSNIGLQLGYKVHGFDVSHYQEKIDWDKLKDLQLDKDIRLSFVFMRATMGADRRDTKFGAYWQEAKRIGLIRAPYHYFDVKQNTMQQVHNFVGCVKLERGDLPPVLDLEVRRFRKKKEVLRYQQSVKLWLNSVEKQLGVKPIVYCSYTFYHTYLASVIKDYPLWIAYYHKPLNELKTNNEWNFWQHSNQCIIDGIKGYVDMNVFNGTTTDLERLCFVPKTISKKIAATAAVSANAHRHRHKK